MKHGQKSVDTDMENIKNRLCMHPMMNANQCTNIGDPRFEGLCYIHWIFLNPRTTKRVSTALAQLLLIGQFPEHYDGERYMTKKYAKDTLEMLCPDDDPDEIINTCIANEVFVSHGWWLDIHPEYNVRFGKRDVYHKKEKQVFEKTVECEKDLHNQKKRDRPGYVYVLKALDNSKYHKIGMTVKLPGDRVKEYAPKLPFQTDVLITISTRDRYDTERYLHTMFKDKRKNGEWFELEERDIDNIEKWVNNGENISVV